MRRAMRWLGPALCAAALLPTGLTAATVKQVNGIGLVDYSRKSPDYVNGLSPRATLALLNAARAWALMNGRSQVLPEDVQAIVPGVVGHRLYVARDQTRINGADVAEQLIEAVPIP